MIQECERVPSHICYLVIQEMIVVTEFVHYIIRRVLLQMLNDLICSQGDEGKMQDF